MFAQSTQAEHEVQRFGEGVVIPIPPRSRVVAGLHLLNTTPKDLDAELALGLHDVPEDAVHTRLSGLSLQYKALEIPPMSQSAFSGSCAVGDKHDEALGRLLEVMREGLYGHSHSKIDEHGPGIPQGRHLCLLAYADLSCPLAR